MQSLADTVTDITGAANITYPLLTKLKISSAETLALEDFTNNMNSLQVGKNKHVMVNMKGPWYMSSHQDVSSFW